MREASRNKDLLQIDTIINNRQHAAGIKTTNFLTKDGNRINKATIMVTIMYIVVIVSSLVFLILDKALIGTMGSEQGTNKK